MVAFATALIAIPAFTAQLVLFGPDAYLKAFERSDVYARLPAIVAAQLTHQMAYTPKDAPEGGPGEAQGGPPPALRALTTEQWTSVLATVLPPDVARTTIERAVRSVFAATAGSESPVTLSLTELRTRLASGAAVDAYFQVARAQPQCTPSQVDEMLAKAATDLPACRPPEDVLAQLRPKIETLLGGLVAQIPDQQDLSESLSPEALAPLRTTRTALQLSPLVPAVFLLLTAAFAATSRRAIARWLGVVLALAGGAVASGAFLLSPEFERRWEASVAPSIPLYWSPDVVGTLHDLAASLVGSYATGLTLVSACVAVTGLALALAPSLARGVAAPNTPPRAEPNS
jgi:hypothetical protein